MADPHHPYPPPPAHVAPIVQALGRTMAMRFLLEFGGAELYVAADPKGKSRAEALIGKDGLRALAALPALPSRIPLAKPFLAACFYAEGKGVAEIARTLRASDVTVRRWLAKERARAEHLR